MTRIQRNAIAAKADAKKASVKAAPSKARMAAPARPVVERLEGEGFTATIKGSKLTIEIDLAEEIGPSESGKSIVLARSDRFQELPGQDATTWLNLLVCRKAEKDAPAAAPKKAVRK